MTMPNIEVVELLLDCDQFSPEGYEAGTLRHRDGRPFTTAEHQMVGKATRAELVAVHDLLAKAAENAVDQKAVLDDMANLLAPYFTRYGKESTVGELRPVMTPADRARLDNLAGRLSDLA